MPVQLLVAASDHAKQLKGQVIHVQDEPCAWGAVERPPNYVVVRIADATKAQVEGYLETARNVFAYSHATRGQRIEVQVSVAPGIVALGGGVRLAARTYLEDAWGAVFASWADGTATFDVDRSVVLAEMKADLLDRFEDRLGPRYRFAPADVDQALAAGGTAELTRAQAQARIVDRLA